MVMVMMMMMQKSFGLRPGGGGCEYMAHRYRTNGVGAPRSNVDDIENKSFEWQIDVINNHVTWPVIRRSSVCGTPATAGSF